MRRINPSTLDRVAQTFRKRVLLLDNYATKLRCGKSIMKDFNSFYDFRRPSLSNVVWTKCLPRGLGSKRLHLLENTKQYKNEAHTLPTPNL